MVRKGVNGAVQLSKASAGPSKANIQTSDFIFCSIISNLTKKYMGAILVDYYYE